VDSIPFKRLPHKRPSVDGRYHENPSEGELVFVVSHKPMSLGSDPVAEHRS
jgi:hypothetical protein